MPHTLKPFTRRRKGSLAEWLAMVYLLAKGYTPLMRNVQVADVEVDLLAYRQGVLCLVEVKYRKNRAEAAAAIVPIQKHRLETAQKGLMVKFHAQSIRKDAVLVFPHFPYIEHVPDAW
jgi:putative endonuclease